MPYHPRAFTSTAVGMSPMCLTTVAVATPCSFMGMRLFPYHFRFHTTLDPLAQRLRCHDQSWCSIQTLGRLLAIGASNALCQLAHLQPLNKWTTFLAHEIVSRHRIWLLLRGLFLGYFGIISRSKILVGIDKVQHAFGISTIPAILPSTGAVPSSMYACSPVKPIAVFKYSMAFRQALR